MENDGSYGTDPRKGARVARGEETVGESTNTVNKTNSNATMNSDLFKEMFGDSAVLFKNTKTVKSVNDTVTVTDIKKTAPTNDGRSEKEPEQGSHTLKNQ